MVGDIVAPTVKDGENQHFQMMLIIQHNNFNRKLQILVKVQCYLDPLPTRSCQILLDVFTVTYHSGESESTFIFCLYEMIALQMQLHILMKLTSFRYKLFF